MAEGNFGDGVAKTLELAAIRDTFGRPSADETKLVMELLHPRFESLLEGEFFSSSVGHPVILTDLIDKSKDSGGISRPSLCSALLTKFIDSRCSERLDVAQKTARDKNFRYFFDFKAGVDLTLSSIALAEDELSGVGEKNRSEIAHLTNESDSHIDREISAYSELRNAESKYLELLRKNNSGFLLLDSVVKDIKANNSRYIDPKWSREYVVAGAELARNMYKKFYKVAEPIYPKQQPK